MSSHSLAVILLAQPLTPLTLMMRSPLRTTLSVCAKFQALNSPPLNTLPTTTSLPCDSIVNPQSVQVALVSSTVIVTAFVPRDFGVVAVQGCASCPAAHPMSQTLLRRVSHQVVLQWVPNGPEWMG
eukprot:CAMPEP_0117457768 /NCGR_PEP_ID=MMETSP0784-20121206/580_1 /TAXON_ID=39447 /ORGANISM="" /LENGTH=125 /DNA_ID=CAMNT_0005251255 /DNA_START=324 /DNA_END=697 /DNA_ORIENTATION=+